MNDIQHVSTAPGSHPTYSIGCLEGSEVAVWVTRSQENSLKDVGGWQFVLTTMPSLTWDEAATKGIYGETLTIHFRKCCILYWWIFLLPELDVEKIPKLTFASSSDSAGTTERPEVHAHITVALDWSKVRRATDDARAPEIVAQEMLGQVSARALLEALGNDLSPTVPGNGPAFRVITHDDVRNTGRTITTDEIVDK